MRGLKTLLGTTALLAVCLGASSHAQDHGRRRHSAGLLLRLLRIRALRLCAMALRPGYFYNGIFLVWAHGPTGANGHAGAAIASAAQAAEAIAAEEEAIAVGVARPAVAAIAGGRLSRWRIARWRCARRRLAAERAVVVVDHTRWRRSAWRRRGHAGVVWT